jgi:putative glutamine amidotransferase
MATVVGISCDVINQPRTLGGQVLGDGAPVRRYALPSDYVEAVRRAGGVAVLLPHDVSSIDQYLSMCDAFVLAGGDDPDTTAFGEPPIDGAHLIDPGRQAFELALLDRLDATAHPVLGVCLGMQLMAMHHGGRLCQSIANDFGESTAANHVDVDHAIATDGSFGLPAKSTVHSCHRQAIDDPGVMRIVAHSADDEIIEAIALEGPRFYLGVQWHPERDRNDQVGAALFDELITAADR